MNATRISPCVSSEQPSRVWRRLLAILSLTAAILACGATARAADARPDCHVLAVGMDHCAPETKQKPTMGSKNDALNLSQRMRDQAGKNFGEVHADPALVNEQATAKNIRAGMQRLLQQGKAGDWYVLVLSGHGGIDDNNRWIFVAYDGQTISDRELLAWTNTLAGQGKKVWIIVDACHSGQLRLNARETLQRHLNPQQGGVLLMIASTPAQCGLAVGPFSTFAQAVNEALTGEADFDGNGTVSLRELRHYAYHRTYELVRQHAGINLDHDCQCVSSLSLEDNQVLAASRVKTVLSVSAELTAQDEKDTARKGCHRKVFEVKLQANTTYTIDLKSGDYDGLLRLEDANGKEVASNDDIAGLGANDRVNRNARIVITPTADGTYRIVATTCHDGNVGNFTLKVKYGQ